VPSQSTFVANSRIAITIHLAIVIIGIITIDVVRMKRIVGVFRLALARPVSIPATIPTRRLHTSSRRPHGHFDSNFISITVVVVAIIMIAMLSVKDFHSHDEIFSCTGITFSNLLCR
jgi:F0F1-type ATP synthase membrane subunit a